jgi:uncharacterized protein
MSAPPPHRVLPDLSGPTAFFWASGADGTLRFLRCQTCAYFVHPPTSYCPDCGGRDLAPEAVTGKAMLYSFTINVQPWDGNNEPYILGIVEIDEQPGLRLMTNIVCADHALIRIGMPLHVVFEDHDPVFIPLFTTDLS